MMLNIDLDYHWIMGEPVKMLITKRQSPLVDENTFVIAIWAGVSSTTPSLFPPALTPATQAMCEQAKAGYRRASFL